MAADEDPELGLLEVRSLRQAAQVCEEHQVRRARAADWTRAQIAAAVEVTPRLCHMPLVRMAGASTNRPLS